MNRFTTKCDSDEYIVGVTTNGGYDEDAVLEKQYEANQKLGKLEDLLEKYGISDSVNFDYLEKCIQDHDKYGELGEQIGCPLEVVFKATEQRKVFTGTCWLGNLYLEKIDNVWWLTNGIKAFSVKLADYKIEWWLREDKSE